jgi:hypothetical protein
MVTYLNVNKAIEPYMSGLACLTLDSGVPAQAHADFNCYVDLEGMTEHTAVDCMNPRTRPYMERIRIKIASLCICITGDIDLYCPLCTYTTDQGYWNDDSFAKFLNKTRVALKPIPSSDAKTMIAFVCMHHIVEYTERFEKHAPEVELARELIDSTNMNKETWLYRDMIYISIHYPHTHCDI